MAVRRWECSHQEVDPTRATRTSDQVPATPVDAEVTGRPVGRRLVLGMLGLGAVGMVVGSRVQDALGGAISAVQRVDPTGITALVPGGSGFQYYSVTDHQPTIDPGTYRLTVGGLVDAPRSFTLQELAGFPQTDLVRDFQCVTGWRVRSVPWSGVRLSDLLSHVSPSSGATALRLTSLDGAYTESLTLEQANHPDMLVATRMLGAPVTSDHGGPVRLYAAPMYGYKSLKWLGGIELVAAVQPGYWERRGYDVDAWIGRSNGRADAPV